MPHDSKGQLLTVGDEVVLRGKVSQITSDQPTYCNILFTANEAIAPDAEPYQASLSARMVEKLPERKPFEIEFEAGQNIAKSGGHLPDGASESAVAGFNFQKSGGVSGE